MRRTRQCPDHDVVAVTHGRQRFRAQGLEPAADRVAHDGAAHLLAHDETEPRRAIGHIVTGRAEKYRGETESWLARHGVQFESLTMTPWHSKAERMSAMKLAGERGGWKAEQAKRLGVEMFIESCPKQAAIIAREAGIPVFCTATQELAA